MHLRFSWLTAAEKLAGTAALALAVPLTGCAPGDDVPPRAGGDPHPRVEAAASAAWLKGVCPARVTVQTPWFPQAELGGLYQLLEAGVRVDAARKRVSGPLLARGRDTGVQIELRAGGPAIGFQPVTGQMYLDRSITIGMPPLDEQIRASARQPTLAVVAPLEKDPVAIGWDPARHPQVRTIADVGRAGIPVLSYPSAFTDYLVRSGQLKPGQVDESYDGSPARYVSADVAVTPFATNEPYTFAREVKPGKQMRVQLLHDAGYPNYRNQLAIRAGDKPKLAACLAKLVPIVQQAQADFIRQPGPTIDLLVQLNREYRAGFVYSRGNAEFSVRQMKSLGIVGTGTDQVLGKYDPARIQRLIDITRPVFAAQNASVRDRLTPAHLATNEFIDLTVGPPR